jgi:hypothetical protein
VQVVLHTGQDVSPLASFADPTASQRTHADEPATLAVPEGHAVHAVLALAPENLPAAHATHAVPEITVPGAHALQVVTVPPGEYWVGRGHWVQTPAALLYWPAAHEAGWVGVGRCRRRRHVRAMRAGFMACLVWGRTFILQDCYGFKAVWFRCHTRQSFN